MSLTDIKDAERISSEEETPPTKLFSYKKYRKHRNGPYRSLTDIEDEEEEEIAGTISGMSPKNLIDINTIDTSGLPKTLTLKPLLTFALLLFYTGTVGGLSSIPASNSFGSPILAPRYPPFISYNRNSTAPIDLDFFLAREEPLGDLFTARAPEMLAP